MYRKTYIEEHSYTYRRSYYGKNVKKVQKSSVKIYTWIKKIVSNLLFTQKVSKTKDFKRFFVKKFYIKFIFFFGSIHNNHITVYHQFYPLLYFSVDKIEFWTKSNFNQ